MVNGANYTNADKIELRELKEFKELGGK